MNTPKLPPMPTDKIMHWHFAVIAGDASRSDLRAAIENELQAYAIAAIQAQDSSNGVVVSQGVPDGLLESQIEPRPLLYPLSDYHRAMTEGPLHYTWLDKPHRLVYDLIAAVRYYASVTPAPQAEQRLTGLVLPTHFDALTGAGIPDPRTFGSSQASVVQQEFDHCESSPFGKHSEDWYANGDCCYCNTGKQIAPMVAFVDDSCVTAGTPK